MEKTVGFIERIALAMAGKRSPWGKPSGDGGANGGGDGSGDGENSPPSGDTPPETPPRGPRNPWLPGGGTGTGGTPERPRRTSNIEDLFKQRGPEGPRRTGGPNFTIPRRPNGKSWLPIGAAVVVVAGLFFSSFHQVSPREQAIVTWLGGKYSTTLNPGLNLTLPWPIQQVDVEDVGLIRSEAIPEGTEEKLILTGDQNLVDLSYLVRWNINDLRLYRFQLEDPIDTLREVAEATMRAAVARQELDDVLTGAGRAAVEQEVLTNLQATLDAYHSGISIQGVAINKVDPPARVEEAFKDVSSAQQNADAAMNRARTYAQELLAGAQGDAAQFNNIYAEYRLAPEVTRRRMYYETMENVLAKTDKTIVEGGGGVTPYLPLPEVRRRAQQAAPSQLNVTPPPAAEQGGQ